MLYRPTKDINFRTIDLDKAFAIICPKTECMEYYACLSNAIKQGKPEESIQTVIVKTT